MGFALLEVRQPGRKPLVIAVQREVEFGRDCDGLLLLDPEVSRRHAVVRLEGETLVLEDLGSTNGTTLNGQRLQGPAPLTATDVARLGGTELRLVQEQVLAASPVATTGSRETHIAGSAAADVVRAREVAPGARLTSIDAVASVAQRETFDAHRLQAEGGTVTIVFSDIESSTELAVKLGDTAWFKLLGAHNQIVRDAVRKHHGKEIKSQGDGFMLSFPSARSAVRSMIDVQRKLADRAGQEEADEIRVRIGIHTGEAIADAGGDLFGRHIILTSRIANLAEGGQILASAITKEIASTGDFKFGEPRQVTLKGIEGDYTVHEVLWRDT